MREVLFRGKRTDTGEWIEGHYLNRSNDNEDIHCIMEKYPATAGKRVTPETVGQFTGLLDKNGQKVFEGDIMAYQKSDGTEDIEGVVAYGKFNCSRCSGVYGWYITDCGDIRNLDGTPWLRVCGNIHDNPEKVKEARA